MIALRSLVFNVAFYVNIIVLMILGLPVVLLRPPRRLRPGAALGRSSLWLLEKICGLSVEFRGLENIPQGGYIIAAKHQSFLETFALLDYAPDFAIILKRQLVFDPAFRALSGRRRGRSPSTASRGRRALTQIVAAGARRSSRDGRQIIIYPEGTRRPPGAPPRYKFGVAALYADTGAPCLPVAFNTGLYWGRRSFHRRPGVAVIEYLPPIPPGLDRDAFADAAANRRSRRPARGSTPKRSPPTPASRRCSPRASDGRRPRGRRARVARLDGSPPLFYFCSLRRPPGDGPMVALGLDFVSPALVASRPPGDPWPERGAADGARISPRRTASRSPRSPTSRCRRAFAPGAARPAAATSPRSTRRAPARPIATRC